MSKKKEYAINYQKHWDQDGTCYRQTINITRRTLEKLKDILHSEICLPKNHNVNVLGGEDYYKLLFLKKSFGEVKNGLVFTNLMQRDFFNRYLKLKLKDRNTCFCIIGGDK